MAKALIRTPRLLVLDEPTASLGTKETAQVEGLITRLHDSGSSILLTSCDNDQMLRLADRILVLHRGRIVEDGPSRDVVTSPAHPYTRSLLAAVAHAGPLASGALEVP